MKTWFTIRAAADGRPEVMLYDEIGAYGVSAAEFLNQLNALDTSRGLVVRLNSPGGDVWDGMAIYNAVSRIENVEVVVDGLAASMASVVAMAGDKLVMASGSMFMIHNPWAVVGGNAAEMRRIAYQLDQVREQMVGIYAGRTGKDADAIRALMDAETWFDADTAVAEGWADEIEGTVRLAAAVRDFDLNRFSKVPEVLAQAAAEEPDAEEAPADEEAAAPAAEAVAQAEEQPPAEPAPVEYPAAVAAEVAALCAHHGVPALASELIAARTSVEDAKARMAVVSEVRALVARAGRMNSEISADLADEWIRAGVGAEEARRRLFDRLANDEPEISTARAPGAASGAASAGLDTDAIWRKRNAARLNRTRK